jgi:hypothetical protein
MTVSSGCSGSLAAAGSGWLVGSVTEGVEGHAARRNHANGRERGSVRMSVAVKFRLC